MDAIMLLGGAVICDARGRLLRFCKDWYAYYDGIPSTDPNHIDPIDVLATISMNSFVDRAGKVRKVHHGLARNCDHLLAQIPEEADILSFDPSLEIACALLHAAVQAPSVLVPVATKVLHRKRRSYIPMLDSVIIEYYLKVPYLNVPGSQDKHRAATTSIPVWKAFRQELQAVREPIEGLCSDLSREGFHLSAVRAIEALIWMEAEPRGYYRKPDSLTSLPLDSRI